MSKEIAEVQAAPKTISADNVMSEFVKQMTDDFR